MSEQEVKEILDSHDKKIKEGEGLLTTLLRQILIDTNMSVGKYNNKMAKYLSDERNQIPQTAHARSSERGNMFKDLTSTRISWRAFAKQIRLLAPITVRFEIHAIWDNGQRTISAIEIPLNDDIPPPEAVDNE